MRGPRRARGAWVAFGVALVVGGAVRAWLLGDRDPLQWQDTFDFHALAGESWFSAALWAGGRAPGVAVLLKILGEDQHRYLQFQAAVAAIGWAALCASVATVVRGRWPRAVAVAAVAAFSVTTPVTMWERSVLSESLALMMLAVLAAAGLQLARGVTTRRAMLVGAALAAWLVLRDSHVVVALTGGVVALAAVGGSLLLDARRHRHVPAPVRVAGGGEVEGEVSAGGRAAGDEMTDRGDGGGDPEASTLADGQATPADGEGSRPEAGGTWRAPLAVLGVVALVLGLAVVIGASEGDRQARPMRNLYVVRVLPYPDRVAWFADHGMPQADVFAGPEAREPVQRPGQAPFLPVGEDDPELQDWLAWVRDDGRLAFAGYALTHPDYLVTEPFRQPERAFNNALGDRGFYAPNDAPHLPLVDRLLARRTAEVMAAAGLAIGWMIGRRRLTPAFLTGAVVAGLAIPHGLVAWHSDGMETARHLVVPALQFHLGVLLMLVGVLPETRDRDEARGDDSRSTVPEALACGGRTPSPRDRRDGSHCLGSPAALPNQRSGNPRSRLGWSRPPSAPTTSPVT